MERKRLAPDFLNIYTNYATGSDVTGDGLTPQTAFKTLQTALDRIHGGYDFDGSMPRSQVVINLAPNVTDEAGVHFAPHTFVGAQGGAAVKILGGDGSRVFTTDKSPLQFYFGCVIMLENFEVECTGSSNGIDVFAGAQVFLQSGMKFGACGVAHINLEDGFLYRGGAYEIKGSAPYHLVSNGGRYKSNGCAINITSNLAFNSFLLQAAPCYSTFQGSTINLNGKTVTGKRFEIYNNAVLLSGNGSPNYFPGNQSGTVASGAQYA